LHDAWRHLTTKQVYDEWNDGLIGGLLTHSGVYNDTPLLNYLDDLFAGYGGKARRKVGFSCANAVNGGYHVFDETSPNLTRAIVSSASIPFVFPT